MPIKAELYTQSILSVAAEKQGKGERGVYRSCRHVCSNACFTVKASSGLVRRQSTLFIETI